MAWIDEVVGHPDALEWVVGGSPREKEEDQETAQ